MFITYRLCNNRCNLNFFIIYNVLSQFGLWCSSCVLRVTICIYNFCLCKLFDILHLCSFWPGWRPPLSQQEELCSQQLLRKKVNMRGSGEKVTQPPFGENVRGFQKNYFCYSCCCSLQNLACFFSNLGRLASFRHPVVAILLYILLTNPILSKQERSSPAPKKHPEQTFQNFP